MNYFLLKHTLINAFVITTLLIGLVITTYQFSYKDKIVPGVRVLNTDVGNLTKSAAKSLLTPKIEDYLASDITVSLNNKTNKYKVTQTGITPDLTSTLDLAWGIGREKNFLLSLKEKLFTFFKPKNLAIVVYKDSDKLNKFLEAVNKEVSTPAVDAKITLKNDQLVLEKAMNGLELDFKNASKQLERAETHLEDRVELNILTLYPELNEESASQAFGVVKDLTQKKFKFIYQDKEFPISKQTLLDLLVFNKKREKLVPFFSIGMGNSDFSIQTLEGNDQTQEYNTLSVWLSTEKSQDLIDNISKKVNKQPVDARFLFKEGKVENFTPQSVGYSVDESVSLDNLQNAIEKGDEKIELSVKTINPSITNDSVNDLGINEILGRGVSRFSGSIPNRVFNLSLGANRVNGTLIAPGETFSLYKTIGEVDETTGYKEAYVINHNRTELDWGGGICQVSTTLFRAALKAGLPIVERNPHAYRVGYYEQAGDPGNGKPGVDAAVFFPRIDFRFKNDTSKHILIQSTVDARSSTLTFEIYGTKDGRVVTIADPVVTNQVKPPDPLYQPDPTLDKGVVKQIDFSAWGANTVFTRKVNRNGETLINESFYTKYRPWKAIYLVGTKEQNPTPTPEQPATDPA